MARTPSPAFSRLLTPAHTFSRLLSPSQARFFWLEALACSQPLISDHYGAGYCDVGTAAHAARCEDVQGATAAALGCARELFVLDESAKCLVLPVTHTANGVTTMGGSGMMGGTMGGTMGGMTRKAW